MKLLKLLDDLADAATWAAYTLWQLKLGSPILIFCEQKRIATNITPTQKSRMDFVKWLNYVITTPAKGYKTLDACTECQKTPHGGPRDLRRFIFFFGPVLPHQSMLHWALIKFDLHFVQTAELTERKCLKSLRLTLKLTGLTRYIRQNNVVFFCRFCFYTWGWPKYNNENIC